jgi:hypothetical protein
MFAAVLVQPEITRLANYPKRLQISVISEISGKVLVLIRDHPRQSAVRVCFLTPKAKLADCILPSNAIQMTVNP